MMKRIPMGISPEERRQVVLDRFAMMSLRQVWRRGSAKKLCNWEYDHAVAVDLLLEYIDDEEITDAFYLVPRVT